MKICFPRDEALVLESAESFQKLDADANKQSFVEKLCRAAGCFWNQSMKNSQILINFTFLSIISDPRPESPENALQNIYNSICQ